MFDWINSHLIQHKTQPKLGPKSAARRVDPRQGEFNN
jgi:hypothetical protein